MPANEKPVNIAHILGEAGKKAWEANKGLTVTAKNERLPAGIENAIALVKKLWIGQYKDGKDKGKPFFMGSAVVVFPLQHEGVPLKGRHTQIGPEPLFNTPDRSGDKKTYESHYAWMMNELMLINPALEKNKEAMAPANLAATFAALLKANIYIRFRTFKMPKQEITQKGGKYFYGKKSYLSLDALKADNKYWDREPMVNEQWLGCCAKPDLSSLIEKELPPEEAGIIEDQETQQMNAAASETGSTDDYDQAEAAGTTTVIDTEEGTESEVDTETDSEVSSSENGDDGTGTAVATASDDGGDDLDALVTAATDPDEEVSDPAKARLEELAIAAGYTSQQVDEAQAWEDVAGWIKDSQIPQDEPEPEPVPPPKPVQKPVQKPSTKPVTKPKPTVTAPKPPATTTEANPVPAIGQTGWKYQFRSPNGQAATTKDGKVVKPVQVEILSVSTKNKTVTVKNLVTGKPLMGVDQKPAVVKWSDLQKA